MHPILFRLPYLGWPVRMFGLYVIDAFFVGTLWIQWQYAKRKDKAFAETPGMTGAFVFLIGGIALSRVAWIAFPGISWAVRVVGVLCVDYVFSAIVWVKLMGALKRHEKARQEADFLFNLAFWLLVVGFFGARLFWVITTPSGRNAFAETPLAALFAVWQGGIVWYGGLLCAAGFGVWYLWLKNRDILTVGDIVMPGVALSYFIARWACLSAGDDFGRPTKMPWGIVFPVNKFSQIPVAWQGRVAIHPTQLYMSLDGLTIFIILAAVWKHRRFRGQVLYLFLMLYAIGRSVAEIFRGDTGRGMYTIVSGVQLSSSQIISIPVFLLALTLYVRGWLRSRRDRGNSSTPEVSEAG